MIALQSILVIVSESLNVPESHIKSKSRRADIIDARCLFVFFARLNDYGVHQIADLINRDHSACTHFVKRIKNFTKTDIDLAKKYIKCSTAIRSFKKSIDKSNG